MRNKQVNNDKILENLGKITTKLNIRKRAKTQKTLYIADEQNKILERVSNVTGISQGEMVRRALDIFIDEYDLDKV